MFGDGDERRGILREYLPRSGMEHVVELQPLPGERSVQRLPGHVIPVCAGLLVSEEEEPVVQSAQSEGADVVIDAWDQTDPCVADDSEGHHPGLSLGLAESLDAPPAQ